MKNKDQKITWSRIKYVRIYDDIDVGRYIDVIDRDIDIDYRYHTLLVTIDVGEFASRLTFFLTKENHIFWNLQSYETNNDQM